MTHQPPIMNLTPTELSYAQGTHRTPPKEYRISHALRPILADFKAKIEKYGSTKPRRVDYDHSVSIPAFNAWIDRQVEKHLAEVRAKREAAATVKTLVGQTAAEKLEQANGEVLR